MQRERVTFYPAFITLIVCALLGAGCTYQRTNAPTASSTIVSSSASVAPSTSTVPTPRVEAIDTNASRLLFLEGLLPEYGNASLTLTLGKEFVNGRYASAKASGSIYGTVGTSTTPIQFSFLLGNEDLFTFIGAYEEGKTLLSGTIKRPAEQTGRPITFTAKRLADAAHIVLKKIEHTKTLQEGVSCHTSHEYPVIVASDTVSADRAEQMNRQIRSLFGETATTTLEALIERTQAECLAMQEENVLRIRKSEEELGGMNQYEYETSVIVTRNERGLLSFLYPNYSYTGGAHPNALYGTQTFDLATGQELATRDLVRADRMEEWIRREEQALLRTDYGEWLFDQASSLQIADGRLRGEAASSTSAYISVDQWYLQGNTLVRQYQPYEITPYAAGAPIVELPFSAWQDLAVPGVDRWFH